MRDLILVRGAPGSGKSTWIAQNNLQPYCISSDAVRLMFSSPEIDPSTGEEHISQRHENLVWQFIEQIADIRMQTGQFLVIDAQNIKIKRWLDLADKYRYKVWRKDIEATLDECLERNAKRPIFQRVPEHVIMASTWKLDNSQLTNRVKPVTDEVVHGDVSPKDFNSYERIFIIGDIHSCYTPLKAFFDSVQGPKDSDCYIFVGDTMDRGLEHRETLEFMCSLRANMNIIFIAGNHIHEKLWAEDRIDEIKSREFLNNTMPALDGADKKAVREWCSRWAQLAYFSYNGKRYFVTHAGIGFMPEHIRFVPTHMYQRGGQYEQDVDKEWCEKNYGPDLIQVHGHRNFYCYEMDDPLLAGSSVNLNSAVEFGEPLRVMCITREGHQYLKFENPVHRTGLIKFRKAEIIEGKALATPEEATEILVDNLRKAKGINEKVLKNNISSFNFTRDVFNSDAWDDICMIARGLFIDTYNYRILARGFVKFFNYAEKGHNTPKWLREHLTWPVSCYHKYNGFLGLVSWNPAANDLFIASKSTNDGDHSQLAADILKRYVSMDAIIEYLRAHNCTMLFEICTQKDSHVIHESEGAVLLAIVHNTINFRDEPYEVVKAFAEQHGIMYKKLDAVVHSWEELEPMLENKWVIDTGSACEGWVLSDANGYNFKLKTNYYVKWRRLRTIKEHIERNDSAVNAANMPDGLFKSIVLYMEGLNRHGLLACMSLIQVREAWLADGGQDFQYNE